MREQQQLVRDVLRHSRTRGAARSVMGAFALHADLDTLESRPGNSLLADHGGVKPRQVERIVPKIVELGELVRVQPGGGRVAATYRILVGSYARLLTTSHAEIGGNSAAPNDGGAPSSPPSFSGSIATDSCGAMTGEQNIGTTTPPISPSTYVALDLERAWDDARRRLAALAGEFVAYTWIRPLELVAVDDQAQVLVVEAPRHVRGWVRERYQEQLERLLSEAGAPAARIRLVAPSTEQRPAPGAPGRRFFRRPTMPVEEPSR